MVAPELPNKPALFAELEPRLATWAARLGISDPDGEAKSWWLNFSELYDKIAVDPGHQIFVRRETGEAETDPAKIKRNLSYYIISSFKYWVLIQHRENRRFASIAPQLPAQINHRHHEELMGEAIDSCDIKMSNLIGLVEADVAEFGRSLTTGAKVSETFFSCCAERLKSIMAATGDIPIVVNQKADTDREFFVPDILGGAHEIQKLLAERLDEQTNVLLLRRLLILTNSKNYGATARIKLERYQASYKGGWRRRLLVRYGKK